jgi:hypothetical protein
VLAANSLLGSADAFRDGLRQFGYVEGKNIAIEWRLAYARSEWFPELAAELAWLKGEVIVATNNPAVAAAQEATATIPGHRSCSSWLRHQPRAAGRQHHGPDHSDARVLRQTPRAHQGGRAKAEVAAPTLGLQVHTLEVRNRRDVGSAVPAMTRPGRERARHMKELQELPGHQTFAMTLRYAHQRMLRAK